MSTPEPAVKRESREKKPPVDLKTSQAFALSKANAWISEELASDPKGTFDVKRLIRGFARFADARPALNAGASERVSREAELDNVYALLAQDKRYIVNKTEGKISLTADAQSALSTAVAKGEVTPSEKKEKAPRRPKKEKTAVSAPPPTTDIAKSTRFIKTNVFSFLLVALAKDPSSKYSLSALLELVGALPDAEAALSNGQQRVGKKEQKANLAAILSSDNRINVDGDKVSIVPKGSAKAAKAPAEKREKKAKAVREVPKLNEKDLATVLGAVEAVVKKTGPIFPADLLTELEKSDPEAVKLLGSGKGSQNKLVGILRKDDRFDVAERVNVATATVAFNENKPDFAVIKSSKSVDAAFDNSAAVKSVAEAAADLIKSKKATTMPELEKALESNAQLASLKAAANLNNTVVALRAVLAKDGRFTVQLGSKVSLKKK